MRHARSGEIGGGGGVSASTAATLPATTAGVVTRATTTATTTSSSGSFWMSSSSDTQLGVFDAQYFPEITEESSNSKSGGNGGNTTRYTSPISALISDIRRKNIAASVATSSSSSNANNILWTITGDSSDPWAENNTMVDGDYYNNTHESMLCHCVGSGSTPQKRSGSIGGLMMISSPARRSRGDSTASSVGGVENTKDGDLICPICNKKRPTLLSSSSSSSTAQRLSSRNLGRGAGSPGTSGGENPQHALHLLQDTPQLRFVSPQSTDMNGGDVVSSFSLRHLSMLQKMVLRQDTKETSKTGGGGSVGTSGGSKSSTLGAAGGGDYHFTLVRERANQRAASELAALLWTLAHEMSLEGYGAVEVEVLTAVFALVHDASSQENRMAGLAAMDALLAAPSADEERKVIQFANTLSQGLRNGGGDFEFLSAVSKALGHMARGSSNVDFVESEITRALEWLRTDRSDRRLAACLALKEFAIHAPAAFHSKTSQSTLGQGGSNEFLDYIFQAIRDPQPIVRACATDALSQCLQIIVERRHPSLTGLLCQVHFSLMEGLQQDSSASRKKSLPPWHAIDQAEGASQHGSLLVVSSMLAYTGNFMLPRYEEVCRSVLAFTDCPKALIRLEVVRLIPRLARRSPRVFGRRSFLEQALVFLIDSAGNQVQSSSSSPIVNVRPSAFTAIGELILAMADETTGHLIGGSKLPTVRISSDPDNPTRHQVQLCQRGIIHEKLPEVFDLVRMGLQPASRNAPAGQQSSTIRPALHCAANLVDALGDMALPYILDLIDRMFRAGLSNDLIRCLHSIAQCMPAQQGEIEDRMLQEVSVCLAGVQDAYDQLGSYRSSVLHQARGLSPSYSARLDGIPAADSAAEGPGVVINMDDDNDTVRSLVLSLQTLASFGGRMGRAGSTGTVVPLLPFIQDVVSRYLSHPSSEVRRAAALTCCMLLIPHDAGASSRPAGSYSGMIIEEVLNSLLRVAISDSSAIVRLCVVRALDSRYDLYLSQAHHLQELFLLLQDETLTTKAASLQLLGRLTTINPAPILPVLRLFLSDLLVELQCGVDTGRGREEATRLLVVFLRAKSLQRLIHPMLASIVSALPLDGAAPPRLASAALEALGHLALATGVELQPWVNEVIPHVLEIMTDQSSASKQRTSLRTLGQIAGSTGYVVRPYLDYPNLLSHATDILPATKRAPWSLRREVIRTLGILGALDPDRYLAVASKTRKRGAVGGAYFEEIDLPQAEIAGVSAEQTTVKALSKPSDLGRQRSRSELPSYLGDGDDDQPAALFMYEQYAMVAQPLSSLPPAKKMTPADEEFYPTVSIQALMRIFRDPGLAVHHGMVIQAIMFIFTSLGLGCVPYLHQVVPHMIAMTRTCPSNLRESLFKQLSTLALIVKEHLRIYAADIFEAVEPWWNSRHLSTIFALVSSIAIGVPDEFRKFVPRLVRRLLTTLDELQVADWAVSSRNVLKRGGDESRKLGLILGNLSSLRGVLSPQYLHILVPALLKLADSLASLWTSGDGGLPEPALIELSVSTFRTISVLLETKSTTLNSWTLGFYNMDKKQQAPGSSDGAVASRAVQQIVRVFQETPPKSLAIGLAMIETLCVCARQAGASKWMQLYEGVVRSSIVSWESTFPLTSNGTSSLRGDPRLTACLQVYDDIIDDLQLPPHRQQGQRVLLFTPNTVNSTLGADAFQSGSTEFGPIFDNFADLNYEQSVTSPLQATLSMSNRPRVNQAALQRAWDVTQRASRDDWDEWMRRLSIQLLREAPSPALRATASLAQAYQPLSRELFSAAFACCWQELSERYRANLVHALETAFVADVSPEILQLLLNLAEFMEFDRSGGLPIEISILADLALKCRAYAKALHYREREFKRGASNACIESLISINRKLDLPEAALGVLKASSLGERLVSDITVGEQLSTKFARHHVNDMFYSVIYNTSERGVGTNEPQDLTAKQELWLAKLGSWVEALGVYQQKLQRDPRDFEAVLGCMRCYDARGEWRKVLELADQNSQALFGVYSRNEQEAARVSTRSQRKATRMCAQAAWRLGQWDDLEKYSSQLVQGQRSIAVASNPPATALSRDSFRGWVDFDGAFYSAVLQIHRKEWSHAADAIDAARKAMDSRLTALLAESYSRAYPSMVTAQTLAEMEEIIEYRKLEERSRAASAHHHPANAPWKNDRERLLSVWRDRLDGCRADAEVHASILSVRSLVLKPEEEIDATLKLSELSSQAQKYKFAERVLLDPLAALNANINGPVFGFGISEALSVRMDFTQFSESPASLGPVIERILVGDLLTIVPNYGAKHDQWSKTLVAEAGGLERLTIQHRLYFAYVKHLWFTGHEEEAMSRLSHLCDVVDMVSHCEGIQDTQLRVAVLVELGEWKISEATSPSYMIPVPLQADALTAFKRATMLSNCGYKAWHTWALLNFRIAQQSRDQEGNANRQGGIPPNLVSDRKLRNHVVAAVNGFANAVSLGTKRETASVQQDLLNLLSCLFKYGSLQDVAIVINKCIGAIAIEAWLGVLPQLLARIQIKDPAVRSVLHPLLTRLGEKHPQALMYPLSVLLKSPVFERKHAAEVLMSSMRGHSKELVEEALLVSSELIRVAILWLETWHEGLEEASRLYFGEGNVSGMLDLLLPLHEKLERGAETKRESDFLTNFGQDLAQAHQHIKDYVRLISEEGTSIPTGPLPPGIEGGQMPRQSEEAETAMNKAWDIYYCIFRRINKQLPSLTKLDLSQCSPALSRARSLELGVPGSYRVDGSYVKIQKFVPNVHVITSKQRPRKITLRGNDGKDYMFLLKGHEDLRQDERVMQLFGLVNALLARDPQTKKHDLSIQRYAISPLSHNCGLVGWVPHCDTFHSLIRDYRSAKRIPLNMENCEMLKIAPDYELLTIMQKVEVFTEALKKTTGQGNDLYEILWLKSTNSEEWLERRTKFTRSLAVMSMVGYILGLGDRHPSNLMLDKLSGRVLHIDFGDCFEVAVHRDKFPERVPFRLTRMLIRAMEVGGIEGSYRSTCERTMTVLRDSRDSLVAMLEAFVYDPLISWRLADLSPGTSSTGLDQDQNRSNNLSRAQGGGAASLAAASRAAMNRGMGLSNALSGAILENPGEDEDREEGEAENAEQQPLQPGYQPGEVPIGGPRSSHLSSRARSLQMYQNIQAMAANLSTDSRVLSIAAAGGQSDVADMVFEGSIARSRMERTSMRQRELMSLLEDGGAEDEEALNEKALKVIRRVQDKLTGTDFPDDSNSIGGISGGGGGGGGGGGSNDGSASDGVEPLDVPDQVQRLIIQATSSENLCQLFIGWCAFW